MFSQANFSKMSEQQSYISEDDNDIEVCSNNLVLSNEKKLSDVESSRDSDNKSPLQNDSDDIILMSSNQQHPNVKEDVKMREDKFRKFIAQAGESQYGRLQ